MKSIFFPLLFPLLLTSCAPKITADQKVALKNKLDEIVKTDQIAAARWEPEWEKYKDSVFSNNKTIVEKMFDDYGFLGFDKVGTDGSNNFWLIVQHCDKFPEFQRKILKEMKKQVLQKNANANNYAYLFDRVQVNAGLQQQFGTQLTYEVETTGRAIPKIGLLDSLNVDKIRHKYNLNPLKEYLNQMTTMHYEMNKEHYQKKGIMKPNLY